MKINTIINYLLILIGAIVAIYAQAEEEQDVVILIIGIVILMLGIYRISRNIPSKYDRDNTNQDINNEQDV